MPAANPVRRKLVGTIAAIERHHGPDDPRLDELREQLDATAVEELQRHVAKLAASLDPLNPDEVRSVARAARRLDARRNSATSDEEAA